MRSEKSLLIVEDEFGLAELLRDMLVELGYEVALAINGKLALEILTERRVDIVVTDMMMPVMDGPELASIMRRSTALRSIPIVMMTSLPTTESHVRELFDFVITKPFTPGALLKVLGELAGRQNGNGAGAGTTDE
jgi:CheY-like chemotaxis protein